MKYIVGIGIILIALFAIFSMNGLFDIAKTKPGLELTVTVENDNVTNATMKQVMLPFFYKQTNGKVTFPDISVNARLNNIEAKPISYWSSKSYHGDGTYLLTLTFENSSIITPEDVLLMPIRITDLRGHIIYKTTALYQWR